MRSWGVERQEWKEGEVGVSGGLNGELWEIRERKGLETDGREEVEKVGREGGGGSNYRI